MGSENTSSGGQTRYGQPVNPQIRTDAGGGLAGTLGRAVQQAASGEIAAGIDQKAKDRRDYETRRAAYNTAQTGRRTDFMGQVARSRAAQPLGAAPVFTPGKQSSFA